MRDIQQISNGAIQAHTARAGWAFDSGLDLKQTDVFQR